MSYEHMNVVFWFVYADPNLTHLQKQKQRSSNLNHVGIYRD